MLFLNNTKIKTGHLTLSKCQNHTFSITFIQERSISIGYILPVSQLWCKKSQQLVLNEQPQGQKKYNSSTCTLHIEYIQMSETLSDPLWTRYRMCDWNFDLNLPCELQWSHILLHWVLSHVSPKYLAITLLRHLEKEWVKLHDQVIWGHKVKATRTSTLMAPVSAQPMECGYQVWPMYRLTLAVSTQSDRLI